MKKIFTLSMLLMMVFIGAKATNINDDIRFYTCVSSFDGNGNPGGVVTMTVDKDLMTTISLPRKNQNIYSNKVQIDVAMQNIAGFGVTNLRTYSKVMESGQSETRSLYTYLSNLYNFEDNKTLKVNVVDKYNVDFVIKKITDNQNYFIITMTPQNVEVARSAWNEITSHLESKTLSEDNSHFTFAKGSSVINGTEFLNFTSDCTLDNSKNLRNSIEAFKKGSELKTIDDSKIVKATLTPNSNVVLGTTSLTLKDSLYITIDNDNHTAVIEDFFNTVKYDVDKLSEISSDSELKKDFISDVLSWVQIVDKAIFGKSDEFPLTVKIDFHKSTTTAINAIPAENTSSQNNAIYTIDGRRVSNMQHGIYIINGKKIVK